MARNIRTMLTQNSVDSMRCRENHFLAFYPFLKLPNTINVTKFFINGTNNAVRFASILLLSKNVWPAKVDQFCGVMNGHKKKFFAIGRVKNDSHAAAATTVARSCRGSLSLVNTFQLKLQSILIFIKHNGNFNMIQLIIYMHTNASAQSNQANHFRPV